MSRLTRRGGDPSRGVPQPLSDRAARFVEEFFDLLKLEPTKPFIDRLALAPEPEAGALRMLRIAEVAVDKRVDLAGWVRESERFCDRLIALTGFSEAAADHLIRWPDSLALLAGPTHSRTQDTLLIGTQDAAASALYDRLHAAVTAGDSVVTGEDGRTRLRRAYRDALISLLADDLTHPAPTEIVSEVTQVLSDLAGAVIAAAHTIAAAEVPDSSAVRLAVIAMGKCGARELNYVSDVDVMYVYAPAACPADGGDAAGEPDGNAAAGDMPNPADAGRTAAETATAIAHRIRDLISDPAAEPALWELDAALRPEGKAGPLVRTIGEFEQYYRKVAHNWEFQALLKARSLAGDEKLGEQFEELAAPFVWEASRREGFIPEVRAMRKRVVDLIPAKDQHRQLKLGPGGLRDVEFSCQLLQLVHGRDDDALQVRNTLAALTVLGERGYMSTDQAQSMAKAYAFMRVMEHRLQIPRLSREALIPDKQDKLRVLARAVYPSGTRNEERLLKEREDWARIVRSLHEQIFYRPILEAAVSDAHVATLSEDAARERLQAFGFRDPQAAMKHIQALSAGVGRAASVHRQVLPALLDWFSDGVNPDAALLAFRRLSEKLSSSSWYLKMLRDSGVAARRAARVLSLSSFATELLLDHPEAVAWLGDSQRLEDPGAEQITGQMHEVAVRHGENAVAGIRAVYGQEVLRVALADILGLIDSAAVMRRLSALMDMAIDASLLAVRKRLDAQAGFDGYEFAIVAMGRLGGAEIGYFSDADVMFVYRPLLTLSEAAASQLPDHVRSVALALTKELGAPLSHPRIDIDADLRPEGKSGPLVRSLASYEKYYAQWSEPWEAQALLRARVIAGDAALAADYQALIDPLRYPQHVPESSLMQMRRLKARMESERLPRGADKRRHLKLGLGGLSDVEWTAQLIQLEHAAAVPAYRTTSTLPVLESAAEHGHLSPEAAAELISAWERASRVRSAITLYRGRIADSLPANAIELDATAQLMGYSPDSGQQLVDDYLGGARRARRIMEIVFYGDEE